MNISTIAQKLWNYCNVLRDDGMSYGDYVEQSALAPTLSQRERGKWREMADERTKAPYNQKSPVPEQYVWLAALTPALSPGERG